MSKKDLPVSPGLISTFTALRRRHPIKVVVVIIASAVLAILVAYLSIRYMQLGSFKNMMSGPSNELLSSPTSIN